MVNFRSAIGESLGVRSAAHAPLELQTVDTSTGDKGVGERRATECLDADLQQLTSSQLRAQMSVGITAPHAQGLAVLRRSTAPQAVSSRPVSVLV